MFRAGGDSQKVEKLHKSVWALLVGLLGCCYGIAGALFWDCWGIVMGLLGCCWCCHRIVGVSWAEAALTDPVERILPAQIPWIP